MALLGQWATLRPSALLSRHDVVSGKSETPTGGNLWALLGEGGGPMYEERRPAGPLANSRPMQPTSGTLRFSPAFRRNAGGNGRVQRSTHWPQAPGARRSASRRDDDSRLPGARREGTTAGHPPTVPPERREPRPGEGQARPVNAAPVHLLAGAQAHATDRPTDGALAGKGSTDLPPAGWVRLSPLSHSLPPRHSP